jgi:hypothetical protein
MKYERKDGMKEVREVGRKVHSYILPMCGKLR